MAVKSTEDDASKPENPPPGVEVETVGKSEAIESVKDETQVEKSKDGVDIETGSVAESVKGYYSKLSVWLMVLFSGLAIGSDG
jgi:hypothetical protein